MSDGLLISDHNELVLIPGRPSGTENNTYQTPRLWDEAFFEDTGALTLSSVGVHSFEFDGAQINTFFDDWYNRIHLIPTVIDLNNVITDQTRQILLWNAYLTDKSLTSTIFPVVQGIGVSSPVTPPYNMRPLETLTYTLSVSADGPPAIDVTLTWVITDEDDLTVSITGRRVVVWPFGPNWSQLVTESLDWLTDVMTSHYGYEQREQLRSKPRRMFEYTSLLSKGDSAIASNLLWGWQNRNFALPVWIDRSVLTSPAGVGAETLSLDTTNRGFFNGGLLILITGPLDYEVIEIESFTSSAVTLAKPLERSWAALTKVYPVNISMMPQSVPSRKLTDKVTEIVMSFAADPVQTDPYIPVAAASTTYNGYEVILRKPNWAVPIEFSNDYEYDTIDFQVGGFRADPRTAFAKIGRRFQWVLKTKSDIVEFRKLLGRLTGRFKAAYVPTWLDDFTLYSTEVASSSTIKIKNNEFYKMVGTNPALKTLMILTKGNPPIVRLINSVGTDPLGFTTLGLDAAVGVDLNSTTLQRLCLVHLCRLTTDRVTINYESASIATVEANFTLVQE